MILRYRQTRRAGELHLSVGPLHGTLMFRGLALTQCAIDLVLPDPPPQQPMEATFNPPRAGLSSTSSSVGARVHLTSGR